MQTTCGFSRDDAGNGFISGCSSSGAAQRNPFATLDQSSAGDLIVLAVKLGRDPASIHFHHRTGPDCVCCSP